MSAALALAATALLVLGLLVPEGLRVVCLSIACSVIAAVLLLVRGRRAGRSSVTPG